MMYAFALATLCATVFVGVRLYFRLTIRQAVEHYKQLAALILNQRPTFVRATSQLGINDLRQYAEAPMFYLDGGGDPVWRRAWFVVTHHVISVDEGQSLGDFLLSHEPAQRVRYLVRCEYRDRLWFWHTSEVTIFQVDNVPLVPLLAQFVPFSDFKPAVASEHALRWVQP